MHASALGRSAGGYTEKLRPITKLASPLHLLGCILTYHLEDYRETIHYYRRCFVCANSSRSFASTHFFLGGRRGWFCYSNVVERWRYRRCQLFGAYGLA
jgi:hypothetical protein